ncbi:DUF2938 domain-containing protein [Aminobacter sp. AP02]|uniref:DUF2938 domain-containing protein n=1 Tax=Aminobacter sp. AP02 TaxID=2135737 RepID=UPI001FE068D4|nr:DUF2938 domain-containing protein [Aminobacter sp. AP02]
MYAVLIGTGATIVMDLWGILSKLLFGIPALNFAMVGRWIGHFPRGRFAHDAIAKASPVRGERVIGWSAHYAIGIVFAGLLLTTWGIDWARNPTLLPALIVGVLTVAAPFFIMQPGMGAGVAASKTPRPNVARLRSLLTHTVFGFGLYVSALLLAKTGVI